MGKVITAIIVIAILVIGYIIFFDTDVETEGEFETPEVEVETRGEFDVPDTDVDVDAPEIGVEEEVVTVPTLEVDPAEEGEADADAEDDDPEL